MIIYRQKNCSMQERSTVEITKYVSYKNVNCKNFPILMHFVSLRSNLTFNCHVICDFSLLVLFLGQLFLYYRLYNRKFDCFCYLTCYEILQKINIHPFKYRT